MIYINPIEVPGYIIPFILKDCEGVSDFKQDGDFYTVNIEPNSIFGMFLRRRILPDYKIKNYALTIYQKKMYGKYAFSAEVLEFQNLAQYKVDLKFAELDEFYKFISSAFRLAFYYFVKGYCKGSHDDGKITQAINQYIDEYDLLEYGYNVNQLRKILNTYSGKGPFYILQRNNELPKSFWGIEK